MIIFVVSVPWVAELGRLDNVRDSAITEKERQLQPEAG